MEIIKINQKIKGFTLVELIVVMAIMAILIAISIPSYTQYVTKTHRQEAQAALVSLAARMEQYFIENQTYQGAELLKNNFTKFYDYQVSQASTNSYLLKAIPQSSQAKNDKSCGTLEINQTGEKFTSTNNNDTCW